MLTNEKKVLPFFPDCM